MFIKNAHKRREIVLTDLYQYAQSLGDEHLINLVDDVIEQFRDTSDRIILEAVRGSVDDTIPVTSGSNHRVMYKDNTGDFHIYYGDPIDDESIYYIVPREYTFLGDYYG